MFTGLCRFYNCDFDFINYGSMLFIDTWRHRLDPYRIVESHEDKPRVIFQKSSEDWSDDFWSLVSTIGNGFFRMKVYINNKGDSLWEYTRSAKNEVYTRLWMANDYSRVCLIEDNSQTGGNLPYICLGYLTPLIMLKYNAITLHGVLMEHDGRGIIISAPSGFGKTTHARLWRDHKRALILNGDRATCCVENGKWIGFSLPWCGTSGEFINRNVSITCFVALEQSEINEVERLYGLDAFGAILPNVRIPKWDKELTEKALDFIDSFLKEVPVFRLRCRPDVESVEVLDQALREL